MKGRGSGEEEEGIIPPPVAPPILGQILRPLHRVALVYVDGFRIIVGQVLALAVHRWEGVCQPPPLAAVFLSGPACTSFKKPASACIRLGLVDGWNTAMAGL